MSNDPSVDDSPELTIKVSPAVVQILTTGYGLLSRERANQTAVLARQQAVGSGVILDSNGFIITNAHVVKGAERIEVLLTTADWDKALLAPAAPQALLPATLVGLSGNKARARASMRSGDSDGRAGLSGRRPSRLFRGARPAATTCDNAPGPPA